MSGAGADLKIGVFLPRVHKFARSGPPNGKNVGTLLNILENWVKIFDFCVTHKSYYKVAKPHNCLDFTRKVGFPRFSMN